MKKPRSESTYVTIRFRMGKDTLKQLRGIARGMGISLGTLAKEQLFEFLHLLEDGHLDFPEPLDPKTGLPWKPPGTPPQGGSIQ